MAAMAIGAMLSAQMAAPMAWAMCALHLGHVLVVMDKWDATAALELIDRNRVTYTHMVPTQFHRLLRLPAEVRGRYDVSSLQALVHAGAPCHPVKPMPPTPARKCRRDGDRGTRRDRCIARLHACTATRAAMIILASMAQRTFQALKNSR